MLAEEICNLRLDRLREQSTGSVAQDFGEMVVEVSWLNQLDDVIVGHGISLLRWRSEVVKQPHDMPPSRFPPSPTSGHSSGFFPGAFNDVTVRDTKHVIYRPTVLTGRRLAKS
jgi:hypothetical protein